MCLLLPTRQCIRKKQAKGGSVWGLVVKTIRKLQTFVSGFICPRTGRQPG